MDLSSTPPEVKFKFKKKFEPKIMLYIVISSKGISKSLFRKSGITVTKEIYIEECLKKISLPFIKKNHLDGNYMFWPDRASSHYAKNTQEFLRHEGINFGPKERNTTNLPQCRPIEDFFGYLSDLVYKRGWKAENVDQLERRIKNCSKKVDMNVIQTMFRSIKSKLRNVAVNGPYAGVH